MQSVIKASLLLAGLIGSFTTVVVISGLHERPAISLPLFVFGAVILNVAVVFWALRQTATENPYGRQLAHAALIGLIGGVLIFGVSLALTGVVFPDFLEESKAAQAALIEGNVPAGQQREAALARNASRSSFGEAAAGLAGTLGTSILSGALLGFFLRRK